MDCTHTPVVSYCCLLTWKTLLWHILQAHYYHCKQNINSKLLWGCTLTIVKPNPPLIAYRHWSKRLPLHTCVLVDTQYASQLTTLLQCRNTYNLSCLLITDHLLTDQWYEQAHVKHSNFSDLQLYIIHGYRRVKCNYKLFINVARRFWFSIKPVSSYTKEHRGLHVVTFTLDISFVLEQPKVHDDDNNPSIW
jgi:hypothetical protein